MFVGILLQDLTREFHKEFWEFAPSHIFQTQFEHSQKTLGSHLKTPVNSRSFC